jgi:signal transduction histidine kinase
MNEYKNGPEKHRAKKKAVRTGRRNTAIDNNTDVFIFSDVSDDETDDSQCWSPDAGPCKFLGNCSKTVRLLSHETMALLENERKKIAKDIHDSLGGSLAAIKFLMEDILSENWDHPKIAQPLNETIKHIQDAIKQTKRLSAELRPTILDDLGLDATIKGFCRNLRGSFSNISFMIEIRLNEEAIDDSLKIFIYRIIQEAMTNAVTHSGGNCIWMSLVQTSSEIGIEVKDNGCGFEISKITAGPFPVDGFGHGLRGVREKAEICGGSFFIKSLKEQGTCLTVCLPLEKDT